MRTTNTNPVNESDDATIPLDKDLRTFLRKDVLADCQSPAIAGWACRILRAKRMTMADLERCLNLGFEY